MIVFYFVVFGLYFLLLLLLLVGWQKEASPHRGAAYSKITIVVPFRNEEMSIDQLIDDLGALDYPRENLEVILLNDHSDDISVEIVANKISDRSNFRLLSLPEGRIGKKQAITYAIENASGSIIVTTDADCRVPVEWLRFINDSFADGTLKMVLGGVRIADRPDSFAQLQALEFSSLIGVSGATSGLGFPTLCNGANLAFLKSAFFEVNGYEGNFSIASGDDEFLMRKFKTRFPRSIYFLAAPDSVVTTKPQKTISDFAQQRLRWAGKWRYNSSWVARLLAVFILIFHISFLLLAILILSNRVDPKLSFILLVMKVILEYFFFHRVMRFLRMKFKILHFLLLQFVYPVYVIFIGVGSFFLRPKWKGRSQR